MRKMTLHGIGKDDRAAMVHDMDVTAMAMRLSDEIHGLAESAVTMAHVGMIDELGELADALSLEMVQSRSRRETGEQGFWLTAMRLRLAELEAGLVMGGHAGYITRPRLRLLLAMVRAVKQRCFAPGIDGAIWWGGIPS